ncbi:MAG: DUF192 domain-containing protein [Spirochaetia bacterium]|jgi:uncharacterized membrane protein (UPF0127 family)|nr:DUF192 domain-containing protein [Spirochaetia bacterium]
MLFHSPRTPIRFRLPVLLALIVLFAGACSGKSNQVGAVDKPNPKLPTAVLRSGNVSLEVELAKTEEQRNRGMMFRKSLDEGKGMLFVFESDQKMAFWMKNTSIPLSLAYIGSDGTIFQIIDLVPFSEDPQLSQRSIRYALEVPQGWFAKVGIQVGDRFDIPKFR